MKKGFFLCAIIICVVVIFLRNLQKVLAIINKNRLLEEQKNLYLNQYKEITELWKDLREFRHNIRNQYIVENAMLEEKRYDDLKSEYNKRLISLKNEDVFAQTGNIYVDAIVNYKFSELKKMGTDLVSTISVPANIKMDGDDITLILGNLFDNIIEALEKVKSQKRCFVKISYEYNNLIIITKNSYDGIRCRDKKGLYITTKKDKMLHGVGVYCIKRAIDRYNGKIFMEEEKGHFVTKIHLCVAELQ